MLISLLVKKFEFWLPYFLGSSSIWIRFLLLPHSLPDYNIKNWLHLVWQRYLLRRDSLLCMNMSITYRKTTPSTFTILKQNIKTTLYCFIPRLMNHIMMIVISKFIASLFVIPKHPKLDLDSQKLKIICPNFV
jgi:hypothetical protein